jgi:hypothetical protein
MNWKKIIAKEAPIVDKNGKRKFGLETQTGM